MARRRRAKNNLLPKMIGIAVLINAILLPVLAGLGVFKAKKGSQNIDVKLIKLPPERKLTQKKPPTKKIARSKPKPPTSGRHQATHLAQNHPSTPNPNQPKVVAGVGGKDTGRPTIDNNGTAQPGQVTTQPAPTPPIADNTSPPAPTPQPPPAPETKPAPPATPPAPVYVEAEPLTQPQPDVPDDLAGQDLHATFWGLFTIHPDGAVDVKMVKSTGISELDEAALGAARKWTFKPATKDGSPIESYRRLRIDIDVS